MEAFRLGLISYCLASVFTIAALTYCPFPADVLTGFDLLPLFLLNAICVTGLALTTQRASMWPCSTGSSITASSSVLHHVTFGLSSRIQPRNHAADCATWLVLLN